MAFKIRKVDEIVLPETVIGLIYGQPGVGKTTVALSTPKPILIDAENGVHRINKKHRCDTLQVENYKDIVDVLPKLKNYDTLVFDTISEVLSHLEAHLIATNPKTHYNGKMHQNGYGLRNLEFKNLIFKIRQLKKNVIFIAHDSEESDEDRKVIRPDISGKNNKEIIKLMDFVGYTEMFNKKRIISFMPSQKYYAKNSIELGDHITLPDVKTVDNTFLTDYIINPTMKKRKEEQKLSEQKKDKAPEKTLEETPEEKLIKPREIDPDTEKQVDVDLAKVFLKKLKEKGIKEKKDIVSFCQRFGISSKDSESFQMYLDDDTKLDALIMYYNDSSKLK